jgi:hypothetical protein
MTDRGNASPSPSPSPPLARVPLAGWLVPRPGPRLGIALGVPVPVPAFGVACVLVSLSPSDNVGLTQFSGPLDLDPEQWTTLVTIWP